MDFNSKMVRLEVERRMSSIRDELNFNSKMVRLEETEKRERSLLGKVFQFQNGTIRSGKVGH